MGEGAQGAQGGAKQGPRWGVRWGLPGEGGGFGGGQGSRRGVYLLHSLARGHPQTHPGGIRPPSRAPLTGSRCTPMAYPMSIGWGWGSAKTVLQTFCKNPGEQKPARVGVGTST